MESVSYPEKIENTNTVEQQQSTELSTQDFSAKKTRKKQKEYKHEVFKYQCLQCEYFTTNVSNLKRHERSKHKEVRYSCDQCEYSATDKSNLKQHKISKHEGVR